MNANPATHKSLPAERRARALDIAAKHGPEVVAIVERMDFREANGTEKAIAATLHGRAEAALKRHGGTAA